MPKLPFKTGHEKMLNFNLILLKMCAINTMKCHQSNKPKRYL